MVACFRGFEDTSVTCVEMMTHVVAFRLASGWLFKHKTALHLIWLILRFLLRRLVSGAAGHVALLRGADVLHTSEDLFSFTGDMSRDQMLSHIWHTPPRPPHPLLKTGGDKVKNRACLTKSVREESIFLVQIPQGFQPSTGGTVMMKTGATAVLGISTQLLKIVVYHQTGAGRPLGCAVAFVTSN